MGGGGGCELTSGVRVDSGASWYWGGLTRKPIRLWSIYVKLGSVSQQSASAAVSESASWHVRACDANCHTDMVYLVNDRQNDI